MELTFAQLRSWSGNTDITDIPCPECGPTRSTPAKRKSLQMRIWDDGGDFISYKCNRCGLSGYAKPDDGSVTTTAPKVEKRKTEKLDRTGAVNFMWDKSVPALGSLAQVYLESRQCWPSVLCQSIRFLPARDHNGKHYGPSMISRFGFPGEPITGVHLTKLAPDGSAKAGTDADKLTIGDTVGQPIVVHHNEDRGELLISEGIEDIATLTNVTGWTGWAAGTANRIPAVVSVAAQRGFAPIYVTKDVDHPSMQTRQDGASKRALEQAAAIAPIIPLSFGGPMIGMAIGLDANAMFRRYGAAMVVASVELCEIKARHDRNELTHHQMQRLLTPLRKILESVT